MQEQELRIGPRQRADAGELVDLAARARRAFPRGALDVTETQVLLALARESAGRGVNQAARDLALDASTVSHAVRGLRQQGLIFDAADPADGRRRVYRLSPAGERMVAEYLRAREDRGRP